MFLSKTLKVCEILKRTASVLLKYFKFLKNEMLEWKHFHSQLIWMKTHFVTEQYSIEKFSNCIF